MAKDDANTNPTALPAWASLTRHRDQIGTLKMRDLFAADTKRFQTFSASLDDLLLDYSKNRITQETMRHLFDLARQAKVEQLRDRMVAGDHINLTEDRAALHVALRAGKGRAYAADGKATAPEIDSVLARMRDFANRIRSGGWKGASGLAITDIVNIGIGGSDLGPAMAALALAPYADKDLRTHFVANVDGAAMGEIFNTCRPGETLFIVTSKTFTTQETMENARSARQWSTETLGENSVSSHFVAVSTNKKAVSEFGIDTANMFGFSDWVGGRFSMWSPVGLALMCAIGPERFDEFLAGGGDMDEHFITAPLEKNLPVILALIGLWNINFLGLNTLAVLPYDQRLLRLPAYLQQLEMESNGKAVTRDGNPVTWDTAAFLFGEPGTNGQHAFHQLLHQGPKAAACDFIAAARPAQAIGEHHAMLLANCFAQSEALMRGKTSEEVRAELSGRGMSGQTLEDAVPHRVFEGNRPSNTILFGELSPRTLGRLIALYEHKVFVQGAIWGINSFDQWGVELGKQLAGPILSELSGRPAGAHDSSTEGLIAQARKLAKG